MDTSWS